MSFDKLAPYYLRMEAVLAGGILQRCRTAYLADVSHCQSALLLGEGPGRFLVELLRANPRVHVVCVEASARMIHEARRTLRRNGMEDARVTFEQSDALSWQPPRAVFDLVVTHFFLDCFPHDALAALVAKVAASTQANARWLLADFQMPPRGWRRWRARVVLAVMYRFFRWTTGLSASALTSPDQFLMDAGFELRHRRSVNFGLAHSDLWHRTQSSLQDVPQAAPSGL